MAQWPAMRPDIPTFQSQAAAFGEALRKHRYLGMILVDLQPLSHIEKVYGSAVYDRFLGRVGQMLLDLRGRVLRMADSIAISGEHGEQFMVFLSEKRSERPLKQEDLELVADKVHLALLSSVFELSAEYARDPPKVSVGFAAAIYNSMLRPERVLYRLIGEARRMAQYQSFRFSAKSKEKLRSLIHEGAISTVFQPIVSLADGGLLGYEALSRGPEGTEFQNPMMLFTIAEESDLLFELDQLCRRQAIANGRTLKPEHVLFINTLPASIHDPTFRGEYLAALLKDTALAPSNIVLEVTETLAIQGFERFREALTELRSAGIAIAIDDAGTGYASLDMIVKLRPNFIKIDMSLIRGVDSNPVKQEVVRSLRSIALTLEAKLIAEGIETQQEADQLRALGVHFGQGFLLARPGPAFPSVTRA